VPGGPRKRELTKGGRERELPDKKYRKKEK
jgi:hypothetical protein